MRSPLIGPVPYLTHRSVGTHSRFIYVGNNPVTLVDPSGLAWEQRGDNRLDCSDSSDWKYYFLCPYGTLRSYLGAVVVPPPVRGLSDAAGGHVDEIGRARAFAKNPSGTVGAGGKRTIKLKDLIPIHSLETSGPRPDLEQLSDAELVESVIRPSKGDPLKVDPKTGRVFDGNGRIYELRRRAADPNSSITWDMDIPYEPYTPGILDPF
jgi:hypothetical protein